MAEPLTAAMAWALASRVAYVDSCHDRSVNFAAKRAESDALMARARELDASDDLVVRALAYHDAPVQPAEHYTRPMTGSEIRRVYALRAAAKRAQRKPTKRRGTKPASLPQRLAAAAHAIKEP